MTIFSPEITNKIIHRIAQGRSLVSTCAELKIDTSTVYNWLKDEDKKDFFVGYARARDIQADTLAEEVIDIADNESIATDSRRIRIDARKWYAGKAKPKKYGDKVIHGGDEDSPIKTETKIEIVHVKP